MSIDASLRARSTKSTTLLGPVRPLVISLDQVVDMNLRLGQTLGDQFNSDGRMKGDVATEEFPCDATSGTCVVQVKAPSIVLVFLNDQTLQESSPPPEGAKTFATTAATVSFLLLNKKLLAHRT